MLKRSALLAVPLYLGTLVFPAFAATTLPPGTKFTATSTCQVASSISGITSSSQRLVSNIQYNAREINRGYNDSTHVRIEYNGQLMWVAINGCGRLPVFQSTNTCRVASSIAGISSSSKRLQNGTFYAITAFNQQTNPAASTHVQLNNGGVLDWTAISGCGNVIQVASSSTPSPTPTPTPAPGGGIPGTGPFFDTINNPENNAFGGNVDPTPPPPTLTAFDREMAAICGAPGTAVSATTFKNAMKKYPAELNRIMQFTGYRVFGNRPAQYTNPDQYLDQLAAAWFDPNTKGFDHIFCGEPEPGGKVGGLHFHARYLDLQEKGLAGRLLNNSSKQEIVPGVIYTIGVRMRNASGGISESAIKGYGYTLSAEDLLKFVTKAFRDNPSSNTASSDGCILDVTDDGKNFKTMFFRRASGIRTFYPDATPEFGKFPACVIR
ncbi:MAG: EndoU domain-containing protein [Pseudanabaenaceae cyanobacterium]